MAATQQHGKTDAYITNTPRYHTNKDAAYVLPNDEVEHRRLEEQAAHLQAIMNNNIIHSPIPTNIQDAKMLDIGCGTGIVTDFIGNRFPNAQVYGLDISDVPVHIRNHPPNVQFLKGNATTNSPDQWLTQDAASKPVLDASTHFDLIFSRLLVCGMTNWPQYVSRVHTLLKPGGRIELHDIDWTWYNSLSPTPETPISNNWKWLTAAKSVASKRGMDWTCARSLPQWLSDAGFQDIEVKKYKWPHGGSWQKDPVWQAWGDFVVKEMKGLVWHVIPRTLAGEGYSEQEIKGFQEEAVKDMEAEEGKYWVFWVVTGRKAE
ncbi:hypothetical protein CB0940_08938 [Cercospora beticola]|uniref:Methyltransferase domain-containing protein n=1 Tax=Cercospora beticola TaxID=122368 RepID=A0A2G5HR36_CERBT|nr:hypothetical protein CB0940_08938 [Cercospora beticola]PIA94985.1 hypothetical protein CB0940_08938 [Cercospora beticola]WPB05533.1 hypothetical protein RHO25_010186 [Cercospora beticola]CAK1365355.1 unnamed protein product [Cercospora beticola]